MTMQQEGSHRFYLEINGKHAFWLECLWAEAYGNYRDSDAQASAVRLAVVC